MAKNKTKIEIFYPKPLWQNNAKIIINPGGNCSEIARCAGHNALV